MSKNKYFLNALIAVFSTLLTIIIYSSIIEKNIFVTTDKVNQVIENKNDTNNIPFINRTNNIDVKTIDFTVAAEKSIHAVVHVKTKYIRENNPIYDFFYGQQAQESSVYLSSGSGVIISKDGYIVTNNHVVKNSSEIEVVLNDKRSYIAKIVGVDPSTDLAVLKIDDKNLPYIALGNSDNLKIGEWVLAVGNPFNLTSTVTAGIVSAKARNINILRDEKFPIESFIQTDAAVNPGNSGGALVNLKGELVGINSAIASKTGSYSGYSFAIPVSIVNKIVTDILKYGEVQRAILGISIENIDSKIAKGLKLNKIEGVYVRSVENNGAAYKAGIKQGDIILKVNGRKLNSIAELQEQVGKYRPGQTIKIEINRNNKRKQFDVVLRNMQGSTDILRSNEIFSALGASFKQLDNTYAKRLGLENGVVVDDVRWNGAISRVGIKKGFIITHIQGQKIFNINDIKNIIRDLKQEVSIKIDGVYPNNRYVYVYNLKVR